MGDRKKIALTYYYSENWIAGAYYVANIISAINSLDDVEKPEIYLVHSRMEGLELIKNINYPYINFIPDSPDLYSFWERISNRFASFFGKGEYYLRKKLKGVNCIFEGNNRFSFIPRHFFWVHDFQQCRMPHFFTEEEAQNRSSLPAKVAKLSDAVLILSSYDAKNDFQTYFPDYKCSISVLRFASTLPDFSGRDIKVLKEKYGIVNPYFICSNQFWQHKNHWLVLKALKRLKDSGSHSFQIVFTGKNYDFRNPDYFDQLKSFVEENSLTDIVKFLGFIDRDEQLCLGANSISYIQPSLFEGWSTTVEDVKALNQFILLSDIPVHREQMNDNVLFFDPYNEADLAEKMQIVLNGKTNKIVTDYNKNIRGFGKDILEAFKVN
ncbi:glycosyltransferase family 1 protein [Flavihumibacter sp. ZG627]|uniref:glycosyltransferase family 4 protein n=1 Tax=Flavihumibacter sp. ZG627 TaxID=1463156 RepID=UPI0006932140|nr:glycosyltransferase family 1 protein [Flavihumibacter sp. ZG627]